MFNRASHGFTLIEMIVAMVIIGVGLAGVIGVLSRTSVNSTDPMIVKQMTAIAEGMMEEVQLKPFSAPGVPPNNTCNRTAFSRIGDYNGYNQPVCDVSGTPGPAGYQVSVNVAQGSGAILTAGIPANEAAVITVSVTKGADNFVLVGWRTNFGAGQP